MKAGKLKLWEYTYGFWSILHVLYAYVAVFLDVEQEMHWVSGNNLCRLIRVKCWSWVMTESFVLLPFFFSRISFSVSLKASPPSRSRRWKIVRQWILLKGGSGDSQGKDSRRTTTILSCRSHKDLLLSLSSTFCRKRPDSLPRASSQRQRGRSSFFDSFLFIPTLTLTHP